MALQMPVAKFSLVCKLFSDWLSAFWLDLGKITTAEVKCLLLVSSQLFSRVLNLIFFMGEFASWLVSLDKAPLAAFFGVLNLLLKLGEFNFHNGSSSMDPILTLFGVDVYFPCSSLEYLLCSWLSIFLGFIITAAVACSGLFCLLEVVFHPWVFFLAPVSSSWLLFLIFLALSVNFTTPEEFLGLFSGSGLSAFLLFSKSSHARFSSCRALLP